MNQPIKKALFLGQLIASGALFGKCCQSYYKGAEEEDSSIETELIMHRGMLLLIFIEIVLRGLGNIKGGPWKSLSQSAGQAVLCFVFLSSESQRFDYLWLAILLSLTEATKAAHHLWPDLQPLSTLRYNLPLLTNAVISYFSLLLLTDYMSIHAETISYELINGIRLIQLYFVVMTGVNHRTMIGEKKSWAEREDKVKVK